MGLLKELEMFG